MTFYEFPKMLFKGDDFVVVDDADTEKQHRADGWHDYGNPDGEARKVGAKAKAAK